MVVGDLNLDVLARARLDELEALKLDKCSGFSTDGLLSIVKLCRYLSLLKRYCLASGFLIRRCKIFCSKWVQVTIR
ncbi:hypothetical protein EUTSA_v10027610mg [Eutrema salsugineum]|uniref:COI1 F-box domain-containing protein n=1 Tax=Eutrema salsugineum TaxID=72664 RepID=V4MI43_EUTSA|nr:hypothetical protein EUTSA_v10027610mg [Eutrema salsugineum]